MKGTLHKKVNGWSVIYGTELASGYFSHHELPLHPQDYASLAPDALSGVHVEFDKVEETYYKNVSEYKTNWYIEYAKLKI